MIKQWLQEKFRTTRNQILIEHLKTQRHSFDDKPYRHIIIDNAFPPHFYSKLCQEFEKVKQKGFSEGIDGKEKFGVIRNYDALAWSFPPHIESPLLFFYSEEWWQYISRLFNVECTKDINGCFHHHRKGGTNGGVHNDFVGSSFKNSSPDQMNPWYFECTHQTDVPMPNSHVAVRAIAVIFYMNNPTHWTEGDGGETGLYGSKDPASLIKKVAPLNNRLLLFEVSPNSYHGFIANPKHERNSVIQWLHQDQKVSLERFSIPHERWISRKKRVLLVGATGKLGLFFSKKYSQYYEIVGVGRNSPVSENPFFGFIQGDITTESEKIVAEAIKKYNEFDVIINAAYFHSPLPLMEKPLHIAQKEIETNFLAPYAISQAMFKNSWGHKAKEENASRRRCIINISSRASLAHLTTPPNIGVYSSSKSALNMFTQHLSKELEDRGIRVNAITPGTFKGDHTLNQLSEEIAAIIEGRMNGEIRNVQ